MAPFLRGPPRARCACYRAVMTYERVDPDRLAEAMATAGMTHRSLAEAADVSRGTISGALSGRHQITALGPASRLAAALGVPLEWLCGGAGIHDRD